MGMWELVKVLASLALVFGLMGLSLWALRRMQLKLQSGAGGQRQMRLVETLSVGPRQKIVLMEIDEQRLVIGITAQNMQALGQWPLPAQAPTAPEGAGHV